MSGDSLSLETLLEAAKYLEWSNSGPTKTRAKEGPDFHQYALDASLVDKANDTNGRERHDSTSNSGDDRSWEKRRPGGAGTREVHNKLEKNRRAHLKDCFDSLKGQIPALCNDKKTSNLNILRYAVRHIQVLNRKEKEMELERLRLAQHHIAQKENVAQLKKQLSDMDIIVDPEDYNTSETESTSSASTETANNDEPIMSDDEDNFPPMKRIRLNDDLIQPTDAEKNINKTDKLDAPTLKEFLEPHPVQCFTNISNVKNVSPQSQGVKVEKKEASHDKEIIPVSSAMTTLPSIKSETSSSLPVGVPTIALDKMTPIIATPKTSLLKTEISKTASDTTAKVITTPAISKVPVTRILQQTLVLRAQQQQLQQQQQQLLQQQQKVPISANPQKVLLQAVPQATGQSLLNSSANATHVTLSAAPSSVNATPTLITLNASPVAMRTVTPAGIRPLTQTRPSAITLNSLLPSLLSPAGASLLTGNLTNAQATNTASAATIATLAKLVSSAVTMSTSAATTSTITSSTAQPHLTTTSHPASVTSAAVTLAGLKNLVTPITQIPAQILTPAQVTQLMTQSVSAAGTGGTILNAANLTQVLSQLPGTQIMSPYTMVSPAALQGNQTITQSQLNNVVNSQVLKLGQIPILQQSLPMRPVVMVSMPNLVVTSASSVTPTVQVLTSPATSS